MRRFILILVITTIFYSCVSQDKYDEAIKEKEALQAELQELKFGVPNLLSDAKKFLQTKDYTQAKEKLKYLLEKYSDRPEAAEAKNIMAAIDEEESWNNALNSSDIRFTDNYISKYSNGKYSVSAKERLQVLKIANEKSEYDNALTQNSSLVWKSFITNYPNRADIDEIKNRIIKCEVDEIMGDKATGKLPSFDQTGSEYSSSSVISITNDTQCALTVRYSGTDIKMIEIPAGGTQTVYISSGNYRIAASACGSNYAGTEELHGNYSSKYYIVTSRY